MTDIPAQKPPGTNEVFMTPAQARQHAEQYRAQQEAFRAQQQAPGYVPAGMLGFLLKNMPANDPRRLRLIQAQINREEIDVSAILRGEI